MCAMRGLRLIGRGNMLCECSAPGAPWPIYNATDDEEPLRLLFTRRRRELLGTHLDGVASSERDRPFVVHFL
jgi:hypothetical protein